MRLGADRGSTRMIMLQLWSACEAQVHPPRSLAHLDDKRFFPGFSVSRSVDSELDAEVRRLVRIRVAGHQAQPSAATRSVGKQSMTSSPEWHCRRPARKWSSDDLRIRQSRLSRPCHTSGQNRGRVYTRMSESDTALVATSSTATLHMTFVSIPRTIPTYILPLRGWPKGQRSNNTRRPPFLP